MKLLLAFLFNIIALPAYFMHDGLTELETDCNSGANIPQTITPEPVEYPFRTDLLTRDECMAYANLSQNGEICSPVIGVRECEGPSDDEYLLKVLSRTYINVRCSWGNRTLLTTVTTNIHLISPTRAAIIDLKERNDSADPVHPEVINPIRNQLIELCVSDVRTTGVSAKIYDLGVMPYLLLLQIQSGSRLEIQKKHFSRMSQIRSITFSHCTIEMLEPYTFADLPLLHSLSLEDGAGYVLFRQHAYSTKRQFPNLLSEDDLDMIQKLHCDCSYAWYRNFLKQKPHLISGKRKGEIAIVGNYMTPFVDVGVLTTAAVLKVDCAQNLTYSNVGRNLGGSQYSYNSSCYNLQC
ncbi:uncharacterized protein LOC129594694 [Paramacrobiotus metropolitanus]|uniref:uncharacterized protein LOC129594694 n=1 Tax=Paramacrobiotus metropolitanus TaxID=2943436 RepID=UPI0024461590|nr:uncharacterized protein LOC129594694 [Paramacrobiotus metropolitanus]